MNKSLKWILMFIIVCALFTGIINARPHIPQRPPAIKPVKSVMNKDFMKPVAFKVQIDKYQPTWKFEKLAKCESGGKWNINTGNGYYGGLQFSKATWNTAKKLYKPAKKYGYAHKAPKSVQIEVAKRWQKKTSWKQWGACSIKLGFR